jgi:hypothetical protein
MTHLLEGILGDTGPLVNFSIDLRTKKQAEIRSQAPFGWSGAATTGIQAGN